MKRAATPDIFSEVKQRVRITDLLQFYGIESRRNKVRCPFHRDGTPSFTVYPASDSFYCFGCQAGGSVIDFVARFFNIKPLEAAKKIDCDFQLGLANWSLSEEKKREYAAMEEEQERDNKLVTGFRKWEQAYFNYCVDNISLLEQLEEVCRPERTGGEILDDYAKAVSRKQILEYHLEILNGWDLEEKIQLYRQKHGAVT